MLIKYGLLKKIDLKKTSNFTLFCDENFKIFNLNNLGFLKQNIVNSLINNNKNQKNSFLHLNYSGNQNLIIIKIKRNQKSIENEKLGAKFYDFLHSNFIKELTFIDKNFLEKNLNKKFINEFFHGIELKSYEFKKYKSKNDPNNLKFNIFTKHSVLKLDDTNRFKDLIYAINVTPDFIVQQ